MICALLLCVEAVLPACTATTNPACRYEFTNREDFTSAEFSPDGLLVATSTLNANPVVRSTQDGSVVATLVTEPKRKSVLFSPNGQEIVVACEKSVQVFSTTTWLELHKINFFTDVIYAVAYSHDSAHLAVATDTFAAVYTTSGTLVVKFTGHGYTSSVAFSPDDSQVVSGGADHKARVWSSTTAVESLAMTHGGFVMSVAWSSDGKLIATVSVDHNRDRMAKLWDALDGSELTTFSYNSGSYPYHVVFAPSSKQVAIGELYSGFTGPVTLFGTEAPYAPQAVYPIGGLCLSYSKQGDFLSTCSNHHPGLVAPNIMMVWDVLPRTGPSCPASGVVVSVGGAPVAGVPVSAAGLNEVVAGPVFSLSVLPPPMRDGAFHFANSVVPATTDIELSCCGSATACEFYVVSYNCGDCMASDMNGGFPSVLPTAGFDAGSCSPWFTVNGAGPVEHPMVVYHKQVAAGDSVTVTTTKQALFFAVFGDNKALGGPWCRRAAGPAVGNSCHAQCADLQ